MGISIFLIFVCMTIVYVELSESHKFSGLAMFFVALCTGMLFLVAFNNGLKVQTEQDLVRYNTILAEAELINSESEQLEQVSKVEILRDVSEWNQYVTAEKGKIDYYYIYFPSDVKEYKNSLHMIEVPEF